MRARILNLKAEGQITKAREIAVQFLNTNSCDPWAPLIAVDICKLTSHAASREDLVFRVSIFEVYFFMKKGGNLEWNFKLPSGLGGFG